MAKNKKFLDTDHPRGTPIAIGVGKFFRLNHFKEIDLAAAFIPRWDKEKASWVYKKDKDL